jgi:hypothetical protein
MRGEFNFTSSSNDGARIYVDDSLILDAWANDDTTGSGKVNLARGKHRFEFWYYQLTGTTNFTFSWGTNQDGRSGIINANQLTID